MPLTGQDFLPKKVHDAHAERERALSRVEEWRQLILTLTTKLLLEETAFEDWLAAEPDATRDARARRRAELGLEALKVELRDYETLIRRAPDGIARARKRFQAVLAEEGQAAVARLDAAARQLWKRLPATPYRETDTLREEFRPLVGLAMQWGNILQANAIAMPESLVPLPGAVSSELAFRQYVAVYWPRLGNL